MQARANVLLGSTLMPLPHPMIIAGERFRETYYWDSFWILKGLLASQMWTSAVALVENFFALVDTHGFVPNGCRVRTHHASPDPARGAAVQCSANLLRFRRCMQTYYTNRSQPPLLGAMVELLHNNAHCVLSPEFNSRAVLALTREHEHWSSDAKTVRLRSSDGCVHVLQRYRADWTRPRPESYRCVRDSRGTAVCARRSVCCLACTRHAALPPSGPRSRASLLPCSTRDGKAWYREDCATAESAESREHTAVWRDIASAAESGWDFSSRWLPPGAGLQAVRTTAIVPVDLNTYLWKGECMLARLHRHAGDDSAASAVCCPRSSA